MASSTRKDLRIGLGPGQKDLVNFSVKAQDMITKQGISAVFGGGNSIFGPNNGSFKTTDDLQFRINQSMSMRENATNATTNISQEEPSKMINMLNRSQIQDAGDQLLLPSIKTNRGIGQQSPFKQTLFDNSLIGQKMRRTVNNDNKQVEIQLTNKKNALIEEGIGSLLKENPFKGGLSKDRKTQVKMNPKVLETWINETLQDAEHLDIPGVILKPEHKNPISRYGIDRLALTNAGIPNEMVDRIFRALFVYSVGFYELVKRCLQHTEKKYTIITSIWKVFSILLEYCCKTDYRMLISEISKEHKEELEKLEKEFQAKFQEQAHNERILKQNMEILQKYNEEIEKDRTNERQMRLKLEEEYMQNTKNHEEEVQLRLKFESKLNNMHSVHRDLETRYKRALNELATLQNTNEQLVNKNNAQLDEITVLKTVKAENESRIAYNEEKLQALQREINIKIKQVEDYEERYTKTQDELDLTKYKLQESLKDVTELRLKGDVYESTVGGLKNEKQHLALELKETKELLRVYEAKCTDLMNEINKINVEYQESKREIIGFGEIQKERDERIEKLKKELRELKMVHEDLDLKHGTLTIHYEKVKEQYETSKKDLDDAIEKLHVTNKVRHETEVKLYEEIDKNRTLNEIIKDKEETLAKRTSEIEELDKRTIELERQNEALEIKKAGVERQYELTKKQLNEKVQNLNDVLTSEKETREMWIERYEKEQKEHTSTNAQLLASKSQLKDQILQSKNAEIKLTTQVKANEVLSESNIRLQDNLNEQLARCENLERDLNTQKEIMKQMDQQRKDYIQKLKRELETVESRFTQRFEQITMQSEDYHSRASSNWIDFTLVKFRYHETQDLLEEAQKTIVARELQIDDLDREIRNFEMMIEEYHTRYVGADQERSGINNILGLVKGKVEGLEAANKHLKIEADQKLKYQNEYNQLLMSNTQLKKELTKVRQSSQNLGGHSQQPIQTLTHQNTLTTVGDRQDAQVQTTLLSQTIDQMNIAILRANQQNQSIDTGSVKSQGVRVGGGGEIKKPPKRQVNPQGSNMQAPSLQIGGVPAGTQNQQQQQNSSFNNEILQTNNSKESLPGMSKKASMQSQGNQSSLTIQSQKQTSQKNLDINITPKSNQQMLQSLYPQTTTNQQRSSQMQANSSNQRLAESQMASPRNIGQVGVPALNLNQKQMNDFSSNLGETMASKVTPSNANFHVQGARSDALDNNTIQSSILQSPQGTILQSKRQGGGGNNNAPINLQQMTLMENSQTNMPGGQEYQTIQSNAQLHNVSTEDPAYLTNQNILNSYNQQIGNRGSGLPSGVGVYNNPYDNHSVIMEQQFEDDEDRGRTPGGGQSENPRSLYSVNAYNTIQQQQQEGGFPIQGRASTNHSQFTQGRDAQNSKKSSKQVINYNGLNTVLQNPSNKNLGGGSGTQSQGDQTNKSKLSDGQVKQGGSNMPSNGATSSMHQRYIGNDDKLQGFKDEEQDDDNEIEDEDDEEEFSNQQNNFREQQISRQNDDSLAQDSVLNQSLYNTTLNNNNPNQVNPNQVNQSRMKIDINASGERRNPNQAMVGGGIAGNNTSMQSPMSQISQSVYSNNLAQNKFGVVGQPQIYPQMGAQGQDQQYANKKVKGKTSIRSLIKSAATREHQ